MAREVHRERPPFRLAHRLCILCACEVVWALPDSTDARAWTDDVLDKALDAHACSPQLPKPPAWGRR